MASSILHHFNDNLMTNSFLTHDSFSSKFTQELVWPLLVLNFMTNPAPSTHRGVREKRKKSKLEHEFQQDFFPKKFFSIQKISRLRFFSAAKAQKSKYELTILKKMSLK